eukprot:gene7507-biopygen7582
MGPRFACLAPGTDLNQVSLCVRRVGSTILLDDATPVYSAAAATRATGLFGNAAANPSLAGEHDSAPQGLFSYLVTPELISLLDALSNLRSFIFNLLCWTVWQPGRLDSTQQQLLESKLLYHSLSLEAGLQRLEAGSSLDLLPQEQQADRSLRANRLQADVLPEPKLLEVIGAVCTVSAYGLEPVHRQGLGLGAGCPVSVSGLELGAPSAFRAWSWVPSQRLGLGVGCTASVVAEGVPSQPHFSEGALALWGSAQPDSTTSGTPQYSAAEFPADCYHKHEEVEVADSALVPAFSRSQCVPEGGAQGRSESPQGISGEVGRHLDIGCVPLDQGVHPHAVGCELRDLALPAKANDR